MTIFDVILLLVLGGFTMFGLWFGFIHTFGSIIGTFAGAFFAGIFYSPFASVLEIIFGHPNLMKIIAFIFIFIIINRLVGFGFYILDKIFNFLNFIPFLKTINRLVGGVLGLFEGILVIGLCLFIIARFPLSEWFSMVLQSSLVAPWFIKVSTVLQLMLPQVLKGIESVI